MNSILSIVFFLAASTSAFYVRPLVNEGSVSGPVHPVFAPGLVATKKGLRPLRLEGFSEDDNQDGFVDPIGPAVVPVIRPLITPLVKVFRPQPVIKHTLVHYAPSLYSPLHHPYGYPLLPTIIKPAEAPGAPKEE